MYWLDKLKSVLLIPVSLFDLNSNVFTMISKAQSINPLNAVTNLMALLHYTSIYLHTLHKRNCEYNLSYPLKWKYLLLF